MHRIASHCCISFHCNCIALHWIVLPCSIVLYCIVLHYIISSYYSIILPFIRALLINKTCSGKKAFLLYFILCTKLGFLPHRSRDQRMYFGHPPIFINSQMIFCLEAPDISQSFECPLQKGLNKKTCPKIMIPESVQNLSDKIQYKDECFLLLLHSLQMRLSILPAL